MVAFGLIYRHEFAGSAGAPPKVAITPASLTSSSVHAEGDGVYAEFNIAITNQSAYPVRLMKGYYEKNFLDGVSSILRSGP